MLEEFKLTPHTVMSKEMVNVNSINQKLSVEFHTEVTTLLKGMKMNLLTDYTMSVLSLLPMK